MNNLDWIRSMRKKQGLKGFQLAERLQVSAARVSVLEKDFAGKCCQSICTGKR
jgi:transcriptional regulator with XRE-family HTH domain